MAGECEPWRDAFEDGAFEEVIQVRTAVRVLEEEAVGDARPVEAHVQVETRGCRHHFSLDSESEELDPTVEANPDEDEEEDAEEGDADLEEPGHGAEHGEEGLPSSGSHFGVLALELSR